MEKKEKEKKKIVKFDKIDITNVTDDEIIKSGIRYNTKNDYICYFLMFVVFILAIIPPVLRIVNPKPITEEERNITYLTLSCYKTSYRDNYELSTVLKSYYRDGSVNTVNIDFTYNKQNNDAEDNYVFSEIDELEKLNLKGISVKKESNKTSFVIDYENNEDYRNKDVLSDYAKVSGAEINYLSTKGFKCVQESESKMEVVDVKTGRKVK